MASIVLGMGVSHTPLLALTVDQWQRRSEVDYANKGLNHSDGRLVTYEQLLAEVGPRYADEVNFETFSQKSKACDQSLDHLGDVLAQVAPDVVVIVGDDQRELFTSANQPAIAIYHGERFITSNKYGHPDSPEWIQQMGRGYLMDDLHTVGASSELALTLIERLIDADFDVGACSHVAHPENAGFGHAYGFIIKRLFRGNAIPVLPVLLNTYYGPNVPSARRCHDFGLALGQALRDCPQNLRVAVVASGGLSHFIVDETLDQTILSALQSGDHQALRDLPRGALNSGSSEILNWVVTAGAVKALPLTWHRYHSLRRTPAGTGVGAAFAVWQA